MYVACKVEGGQVYVYAQSLKGTDDINLYRPTGEISSRGGSEALMTRISDTCKTYDNFVGVSKEVQLGEIIAGFETYKEL